MTVQVFVYTSQVYETVIVPLWETGEISDTPNVCADLFLLVVI